MDKPINSDLQLLSALLSPFNRELSIDANVNWQNVIDLAQEHRVSSLLMRQLSERNIQLPAEPLERLKQQQKVTNYKMLILSKELVIISKKFAQHKIELISLKGPVQSLQIFNDLTLKHSRDLDLLVDENEVESSIEVLQSLGYRTVSFFNSLNSNQKKYFLKSQNQILFFNDELKVQVELHWRLFANRRLLNFQFSELLKSSEQLTIAGTKINALGKTQLSLYHCAHGAKHQWSILYWLIEICYLFNQKEIDLEDLYSEALKLGIERPYLQFLQLASLLFKMEVNESLRKKLKDSTVQQLSVVSLEALQKHQNAAKVKGIRAYTVSTSYRMLLRKNLTYKFGTLNLVSINDFQILKLPSSLFFLYYFLRPFLWINRYLIRKEK